MRTRHLLAVVATLALVASLAGPSGAALRREPSDRIGGRTGLPDGFRPAVAAGRASLGRYFVTMRSPSVADRIRIAPMSAASQGSAASEASASQEAAIQQARFAGGTVVFRYRVLVNGFSAELSAGAAQALAGRSDVESVQPVSIVKRNLVSSVPFIGAPHLWNQLNVRGQGMRVAVVDSGIDYTHKDFGGPGTVTAYERNNPNFIEPGTFPTAKVIGGFDFVGSNYDVVDDDPTNDIPRPDADPLDRNGHGTHTAGICCGNGVPGQVGKGVAPAAKLYALKVWDVGNSTDDVLVAAYEFAVDPNGDGSTADKADVLSFSGGVDYGTLNSVEARAAQRVVDIGTVFVASAGNSGNQPSGASAYITGTPANARGVVSVAASVDEFVSPHITVNSPSLTLPDGGIMVVQDWGTALPPAGLTTNLFDGRAVDPSTTSPADAMFCAPLPAGSLTGRVVLVYKGSTGDGDCGGLDKAVNAQAAGATGVVMISLFPPLGLPVPLVGAPVSIPVVMISTADGEAILDALSPNAPGSYNTATVNATLDPSLVAFPQFADSMTNFTSEGPARVTGDLKPDISAPGFNIDSAAVGTGNAAVQFSGTSMAAPHVSGVAVLLRQLHPSFTPEQIKALMMNQATQDLTDSTLASPVSATVIGAGRVQADHSGDAVSLAAPASLSFGLRAVSGKLAFTQSFVVWNFDDAQHTYVVDTDVRYADFDPALTETAVSINGQTFGPQRTFSLAPGAQRRVWMKLTLRPGVISEPEQEFGLYYFHPNMDGDVLIHQQQNGPADLLHVPWHVAPLAASKNGLSATSLDLTTGQKPMTMTTGGAAIDYGDLYLLGAQDPVNSIGEEDIVAVGARSFTGAAINGVANRVPTGVDQLAGITWQEFLTQADEPTEPIEFGVQTAAIHNTTETLEVDVAIDVGGDGVFADPDLRADYLVVKTPDAGGNVCVFDLSLPSPFDECSALYFADYSNYNSNLVGLVVDARAIGLSNATPNFTYQITACTGRFSGDVAGQICDTAGGFAGGTYTMVLDARQPALTINHLVCRGFWNGGACNAGSPIVVRPGSAAAGDDPSILALFPNNVPSRTPVIVTTQT